MAMALLLICRKLPPMREHTCNTPLPGWYSSTLPASLTREEEIRLLNVVHSDVQQSSDNARTAARHALVTANVPLVAFFAKRYLESLKHSSAVDFEDLVQEGTLGLIKAVELFDVRRNVRLSTYAGWHIRSALRRSALSQMHAVRLPEGRAGQVARLTRVIETYKRDARTICVEQLARETQIQNVNVLLQHMKPHVSLDSIPHHRLPSTNHHAEHAVDKKLRNDAVLKALSLLDEHDAIILRQKYCEDCTWKQVAHMHKLPVTMVQRRGARAIKKLRLALLHS